MSIVGFDGPPSWSLNASETVESTKCLWVEAVGLTAFRSDQDTRWRFLEINDPYLYLRSHGKIGDCLNNIEILLWCHEHHIKL